MRHNLIMFPVGKQFHDAPLSLVSDTLYDACGVVGIALWKRKNYFTDC